MASEPTLLQRLLRGRTDPAEEAQVLALLRRASGRELDQILTETDAAVLIGSLDNHAFGARNRDAVRELLVGRLSELGIQARANLAYGLQAGWTTVADALAIREILWSAGGLELTRLKNAMNMRTDAHDLEGLVYADVKSPALRADILEHIAAEASGLEAAEAKVLCDIDDTVVCALHDRRYPRGTIYPGILALLDALDRGPGDEPFSMGDLTFVTARPGDAFGLIENYARASLRRAGIAQHSVLTGTVQAMFTLDLMAGRKIANVQHYHALFPEYRLVFIGDSGQADIKVGEQLWQRLEHVLDLVFIHDVVHTPEDERGRLRGERIHLVDTYVGAARLAYERRLISRVGFERVIEESFAALERVRWSSPEQERSTRALFDADASVPA